MKLPNTPASKSVLKAPNYEEKSPRGMWYEMREGREQSFIARWRVVNPRRFWENLAMV
ncbi:MAG: hypothetical protein LBK99_17085 [Opitutaceae bacterium]|jgi:hypothetical protein|nr:hypothetical protein [Opitutaceae bacterium]